MKLFEVKTQTAEYLVSAENLSVAFGLLAIEDGGFVFGNEKILYNYGKPIGQKECIVTEIETSKKGIVKITEF